MHLLEPDEDSKAVAHHLLRAPARGQWGLRFRFELCRRFLGHELADALGAHFTCFTGTKVQMLTREVRGRAATACCHAVMS